MIGKIVLTSVMALSVVMGGGNESEVEAAKTGNNKASDDLLLINKATGQLAFYQDYKRIIINTVATGKDENLNKTPEGTFPVVNKVKNRKYNSKNIPGGAPNNPLGSRWIGLKVKDAKGIKNSWGAETGNSYGIHGHAKGAEWTIGKKISGGCIRMYEPSVQSLYDMVLVGTNAKIYNDKKISFDAMAKKMGYLKDDKKPVSKQSNVRAKVIKWSGSKVTIQHGSTKKVLSTSNKWYQRNLKPGKTYTFIYKGSSISKVNA